MGKTRDLFKKIRDTKGIFHAKMSSIKDRNGMDLTAEIRGAHRNSILPTLGQVCPLSPYLPLVVESVTMNCSSNGVTHRLCAGCRLQQDDPSCGLQLTLSCILSQPRVWGKTSHEGKKNVSTYGGEWQRLACQSCWTRVHC